MGRRDWATAPGRAELAAGDPSRGVSKILYLWGALGRRPWAPPWDGAARLLIKELKRRPAVSPSIPGNV